MNEKDTPKDIIVVCAGGHARVVIEILRRAGRAASGIVDADSKLHGTMLDGVPVLGGDEVLEGTDPARVMLVNGSREEIDARTGGLSVVTFTSYSLDLTQPARSEEPRLQDIGEMSLDQLLHPTAALVNNRTASRLLVEAHKRLSSPLTSASFVMIALATVLTGTFRRYGGLLRPMVAITCAVVLVALGLALDSLAVRHVGLIPLIWVRAALPGVLAALFLFARRVRRVSRAIPTLGRAL